ncbi:unnamed protein product [Bubo scandiacus]
MTWGWCSPAPGLIGPSSGLNAKVSWQREAEETQTFSSPLHSGSAAGVGERQASRSEEQRAGPPALLQVPPARAVSGKAEIALSSLLMEERAGHSNPVISTLSYPGKQ